MSILRFSKATSVFLSIFLLLINSCVFFDKPGTTQSICVGINYYKDVRSLNYCVADATSLNAALVKSGYDGALITANSSATAITKASILSAIADIAARSPEQGHDAFIFYYSGHGDTARDGSLIMSDLDYNETTRSYTNYNEASINYDELCAAVSTVPAQIRLIILDSCYSGLFVPTGTALTPIAGDYTKTALGASLALPRFLLAQASAYAFGASGDLLVISAAGSQELSYEQANIDIDGETSGHGFFTAGLLESRFLGDGDADGLVSLSEAYSYTVKFVAENWNDLFSTTNEDAYRPQISASYYDLILFKTENR